MSKNSLYFLIIAILLVGCSGPEVLTKTGKQIPFKTNHIYIITEDKADKAFQKIGSIVQIKGYRIEEATPSLGSIKAFNKLQSGETTATLFIFVRDKNSHTVIQLRGVCGSTVFGTGHPGGGRTINLPEQHRRTRAGLPGPTAASTLSTGMAAAPPSSP